MSTSSTGPRLPRCVSKFDLITYFGVSYKVLWRTILTPDFLERVGHTKSSLKGAYTLPPNLTKAIYEEFDISDLDKTLSEELHEEEDEMSEVVGNRAPDDNI